MKEDKKITSLEKVQDDLNSEFPFNALWQDGETSSGILKMLPVINSIMTGVLLVLIIILLTKK